MRTESDRPPRQPPRRRFRRGNGLKRLTRGNVGHTCGHRHTARNEITRIVDVVERIVRKDGSVYPLPTGDVMVVLASGRTSIYDPIAAGSLGVRTWKIGQRLRSDLFYKGIVGGQIAPDMVHAGKR